ncbi:hypothetical protein [Rhizobium sp. X9]|uniref:hypothetical protein n=1 Tax=Rhizobium sp. X9 TaxID=2815360 RepID=UPI001C0C8391|nr:hypothetical protein [Rhizobium sp. X9]
MAGFLFGGNTGVSYNDLQRRREIADALSRQIMGDTPKTTAQGIGALMKGIGAGIGRYTANKGLKEGTDSANSAYESILGRIMGGSPSAAPSVASSGGSGAIPMPGAASEIAATSPNGGGMQNYRDAIASIESKGSGDYSAVGPTHPKMGRALGRYQIMEANIGPWSQAALGRAVTPEEFMANPQLQDAVFDHQFGQYVQKYGPEGAAQAWLGGPGGVGKTGRRDSLGTSIGEYGKRFMAAGGGAQVASLDPSAGMSAADAIETVAPLAPAPAGYRDPMVSAPNAYRGSDYNSPMVTYDDRGMRVERPSQQTPAQQPAPTQVAQNGQFPMAPRPPAPPLAPTNPYQGVDPEMLKLLNNPFLDADKKQIIQGIVQQQMQRNDPAYQLDIQTKQAQLEALRAKPTEKWNKLDDNTLYSDGGSIKTVGVPPGTENGEFRFKGNSVEAQALNGLMDSKQLTPAEAQQLAAGKQITDPATGSLMFLTPQGVFGRSADGRVAPVGIAQPGTQQQQSATGAGVDIFSDMAAGTGAAPQPPAPPAPPQAPQSQASQPGLIPLTSGDGLDAKARQRMQMAREYGLDPNSEEGKRFVLTGTLPAADKGVTAGDRLAIREADDLVLQGQSTLNLLSKAMGLSPDANQGILSGTRAWLGANLPDNAFPDFLSSPESGKATIEYDNIIKDQALGQLKAIFGGNPTEGEREILLEIQGLSNKPRSVRENILRRAQVEVQKKIDYNSARAADLRSGNYYKTGRTVPAAPAAPNVDDLLKKYGGQ